MLALGDDDALRREGCPVTDIEAIPWQQQCKTNKIKNILNKLQPDKAPNVEMVCVHVFPGIFFPSTLPSLCSPTCTSATPALRYHRAYGGKWTSHHLMEQHP